MAALEPEPAPAALPVALVERVLSYCDGDVATLCAAACVARAWRDASRLAALWRRLRLDTPHLRAHVTNERLASLLARSAAIGDDLELLDVRFCEQLTADGVRAALAGRRVTDALLVRGVRGGAYVFGQRAVFDDLYALLTPDAWLDVFAWCRLGGRDGLAVCNALCSMEDRLCRFCESQVFACSGCQHNRAGAERVCEHECSMCFWTRRGLAFCRSSAHGEAWREQADGRRDAYCQHCCIQCHRCDHIVCGNCIDDDRMVRCNGCWEYFCVRCARRYGFRDPDALFYHCRVDGEEEEEEEEDEEPMTRALTMEQAHSWLPAALLALWRCLLSSIKPWRLTPDGGRSRSA